MSNRSAVIVFTVGCLAIIGIVVLAFLTGANSGPSLRQRIADLELQRESDCKDLRACLDKLAALEAQSRRAEVKDHDLLLEHLAKPKIDPTQSFEVRLHALRLDVDDLREQFLENFKTGSLVHVEGEPDGDWGMPKVLGFSTTIAQALLQTQNR